jgi:hypothetical protein
MKENIIEVKQNVDSLAKLKFLPALKNQIKVQREFIDKCRYLLTQLQQTSKTDLNSDKPAFLENVLRVNKQIEKLITPYFEDNNRTNLLESFPDFYTALEKFISESDEKVIEFQNPERFVKKQSDKFHIKFRKPIKKFFYNISNIPISAGNVFRKLFRKPIKEKKVWARIVLLKNLRQYHLFNNLSLKLIEISRKLFQLRSGTAKELWSAYESLDENVNQKLYPSRDNNSLNKINELNIQQKISELLARLNEFEESLINEIDKSFEPVFAEYEADYLTAGTIENPKWKLRKGVLKRKSKQISEIAIRVFKGWANNFSSLGDDWEMNNELYQIRYNTLVQLEKFSSLFKSGIEKNLIPRTNDLVSFIKELNTELEFAKNKNDLLKSYKETKNQISQKLTYKLIPELNTAIVNQNLTGLVAEFDNIISEEINNVKQKRVLVNSDEYDKEIKDSEINIFSPQEILEYSTAPKFFNATGKFRTFINSQVQQIQNELTEIDHISDFNVESALNLLESENDIEKSKTIAVEGLDRAVKKVFEIKNRLDNLSIIFDSELSSAASDFNSDLKSLTQTEKIFNIKLNLAKAKALERSKQVRKKVIQNIKNALPQLLLLAKKGYGITKESFQKARELIGLAPTAKVIASEVSDYLAETQIAIHRLPFVYQRLFEVKPLNDARFFFGRESELSKLNKALTNWEKEKFASTIIVGEKGSGATSLINFFIGNNAEQYEIIKSSLLEPIPDQGSFFNFLSGILKVEKFKSVKEIIEYLNTLPAKKIIIVENLQRLFLRRVDGFIVLKTFFEIMSKTNKNIFWISTSTIYGWIYLDKTIQAFDYFGYVINLTKLNDEQITSLVSKRHRVSGYNIEYLADDEIQKSKTFKKLSDEEKQPYVKKKYFEELNKFAQSNISLALIFWLRSAKEIINDEIKIGSPPDLDYSFLSNLSNDKVFALSVLLLHDGLREEDYANIFDVSLDKSRLLFLLMHDDGIIVKQNNLYMINPLLYRQIVGLLKSKNIIH